MNTKRYKPVLQCPQIELMKLWRRGIARGGKSFIPFRQGLRENPAGSLARLALRIEISNLAQLPELSPGARFPHPTYGASRA